MSRHRTWKPGSQVRDRHGYSATLLAPTWSNFAWVLMSWEEEPRTVRADELTLVARTATAPATVSGALEAREERDAIDRYEESELSQIGRSVGSNRGE